MDQRKPCAKPSRNVRVRTAMFSLNEYAVAALSFGWLQ